MHILPEMRKAQSQPRVPLHCTLWLRQLFLHCALELWQAAPVGSALDLPLHNRAHLLASGGMQAFPQPLQASRNCAAFSAAWALEELRPLLLRITAAFGTENHVARPLEKV